MSVARRNHFTPPDGMRCTAIAGKGVWSNPDGQCRRRKMVGDLCTQHYKQKFERSRSKS